MANLADHGNQVSCASCVMSPLCNSRAVGNGAPSPVECRRRVAAGERIYAAGSPRNTVYALRAGFAQVAIDEGHGAHVVRFLLPGDAAGLDAFAGGEHRNEALALEDSEICIIPAYRAEIVGKYHEATCTRLRALLSEQLAAGEAHASMLARLTAPQRVARFLLELSRRWAERGFSSARFRLPMGRRAIGQHLALTTETVSRVLSDFQVRGWVELPWREIRLLEPAKLRELLAAPARAEAH
jgi:CRP/FNR family transcriptional regulator, anaerobic regulatory protein